MTSPAMKAFERIQTVCEAGRLGDYIDNVFFQSKVWGGKLEQYACAVEALKPLRELHRPIERYAHPDTGQECLTCGTAWPCESARRIYPEEELRG